MIKLEKELYKLLKDCIAKKNETKPILEYAYIDNNRIMATTGKRAIIITIEGNNINGYYKLVKDKNNYYLEHTLDVTMVYPTKSLLDIFNIDYLEYKKYSNDLVISNNIINVSKEYFKLIMEIKRPINFEDLTVLQNIKKPIQLYYHPTDMRNAMIVEVNSNIIYCFTSIQW